jgi:phosphoglycerate dehydrogenase-like enzyme
MRVSRWGWSSYETREAMAKEAAVLAETAEVVGQRSDAEILTVNSGTAVDAALLDAAPSARLVITTTSGFDHLDLLELRQRGIAAARCPMARRDAVVESTLALLLDGFRTHGPLEAASRDGRWARADLPHLRMRLLRGATVGVVGLGIIGRRMVELLQMLGASVVGCDPRGGPPGLPLAQFDALATMCDAVTLHCRLDASSSRLVHEGWLERADGMILVNTARGDVVDVDAAVRRVLTGGLHYLGLDVFPAEPWSDLAASTHPNITFLPHAAGFHEGLTDAVAAELYAAVSAFVAGSPVPHRVA